MRSAIHGRALDPAALLGEVARHSAGATVLFTGSVRSVNDGRAVTGIEYHAYTAMAEREMAAIVAEAETRWAGAAVVCEHRIGTLALGEISVAIAVSHAHRGEAYAASRYVIEELKRRVPIWKREHYADGARAWVEAHSAGTPSGASDPSSRANDGAAAGGAE